MNFEWTRLKLKQTAQNMTSALKREGSAMSDMQDEYDFSKAERGKFYIPQEEIRLPHYLSPSLELKLALLSKRSGKSRDALISMVLENELDLLLTVAN